MAPDHLTVHYSPGLEATRLTRSAHGWLEFLRTQELLRRLLPAPPALVLDVGGATGIHARCLAQDGYRMHVVDPVAHHVAHHVEAVSRDRQRRRRIASGAALPPPSRTGPRDDDVATIGVGDPACDLIPAWNLLSAPADRIFRDNVNVDDATWTRGRRSWHCPWPFASSCTTATPTRSAPPTPATSSEKSSPLKPDDL